jgi:hypothetical protein
MKNLFLKHLEHFAKKTEISYSQMEDMLFKGAGGASNSWYQDFRIFSQKLDGKFIRRNMYSVAGPSGRVKYDYYGKGYMIFYDETKGGYRTIVLKNVTKIIKDGVTFYVR